MNDDIIVELKHTAEATIIAPQGEIDLSHSPSLRMHITEAQASRPPRLIIDLAGVPYIDSSGVATLVEAMQNARRHGGKLILCCIQERVRSMLEIARLDSVFTIVPNAEEGLKA